ncbi:MAG: inner membrane protein YpjD [Desulfovibrionaceae bacterium]
MGSFELLQLVVILLYLSGSVIFFAGAFKLGDKAKKTANMLAMAGFCVHTLLLGMSLAQQPLPSLSSAFSMQLLSWALLLVYFLVWWRLKLAFLAMTASPLALLLFALSLKATTHSELPKSLSGLFFGLHIGALFASIALLAMAFGAGVIFIHLEKKIKTKAKISDFDKDLPALATIDKVNHVAVAIGFPLYTLGLVAGFVWATSAFDRVFSWDPKEVVALVTWFVFAILFHQRTMLGWRGRKPAVMAVWVFAITIFSLIGINFFVHTHHSFKP